MTKTFVSFIALCALVGVACASASTTPAAASVNNADIPLSEISEALDRFEKGAQFEELSRQQSPQELRRTFEQGYLSQLIRREVLSDIADERGITVGDEEISDRLEQLKTQFASEEEFQKAAKDQGLIPSQLNELVRDQIIEEKLRAEVTQDLRPSDEELRDYYEAHMEDYRQTRASHILVEKEPLAKKLSKQLRGSKANQLEARFGVAAKKFSSDPGSAAKSGDLGFFSPGNFVAEFQRAADKLQIGEVSDPVQSEFGFHVIMVTDRKTQPLDEASDEIASTISGGDEQQAFNEFMVEAYKAADIEVNPRFGKIDVSSQQVVNTDADDVPGVQDPGNTSQPSSPAPETTPGG